MANGIIPFSDMPNTFMLLEKMRGSTPRLLDSKTYEMASSSQNQELVFSGQKPADSGVGASQNQNYCNRTFSDNFHDFVEQCCMRDAELRPSAAQLLSHAFIKQLKKSSSASGCLSLSSLVSNGYLINSCVPVEDEDSLVLALHSRMVVDEVQWDF